MLVLWSVFGKTVQVFPNVTRSKIYMNFVMKIKTCKANLKIHVGVINSTDLYYELLPLLCWSIFSDTICFLCRKRNLCFITLEKAVVSILALAFTSLFSVTQLPVPSLALTFLPTLVEWSEYMVSHWRAPVLDPSDSETKWCLQECMAVIESGELR